ASAPVPAIEPAVLSQTWKLDELPAESRLEAVAELVRAEVAQVIGLTDIAEVDLVRGLFDMGMDSLMVVELRARLEKKAGRKLPVTLTVHYPKVTALAQYCE